MILVLSANCAVRHQFYPQWALVLWSHIISSKKHSNATGPSSRGSASKRRMQLTSYLWKKLECYVKNYGKAMELFFLGSVRTLWVILMSTSLIFFECYNTSPWKKKTDFVPVIWNKNLFSFVRIVHTGTATWNLKAHAINFSCPDAVQPSRQLPATPVVPPAKGSDSSGPSTPTRLPAMQEVHHTQGLSPDSVVT